MSLFGPEGVRRLDAGDTPLEPQWIHHPHQVQDGDNVFGLGGRQEGDVIFSIDLKDTYPQVLIYPDSQPYLRIALNGKVFQFKALCFDFSTAP